MARQERMRQVGRARHGKAGRSRQVEAGNH
jgi:hypothetical protein